MLIHLGVTHIRATLVRHPGAVSPLMRRRITVDGKWEDKYGAVGNTRLLSTLLLNYSFIR